MAHPPTRILIVDDSALYRQAIYNVLHGAADIAIVGTAKDGSEALKKIEELDPDLLTLDVQMPDLDGIGVLREINSRGLRPKSIMVSSLTSEGAQVTTDALLEGAFDFILKPSGSDTSENLRQLHDGLIAKISAFREGIEDRPGRRQRAGKIDTAAPPEEILDEPAPPKFVCRAVLIGTSTGGPAALKVVLPQLPASVPVPILVVQHMPAQFTQSLSARLDDMCPLQVVEAANGTEARAGRILVAPGGRQMKLMYRNERMFVRTTDDPAENACRPSVDYLFRSAVSALKGQALGVIMTGMGQDGLAGCHELKRRGGYVFAQHRRGCVVFGMPKAVIDDGIADRVVPLGRIGPAIVQHINRSQQL